MKTLKFLFICLFCAGLTACDKKDECLDSGGSYQADTQRCEH
ncbi:hypothetical protein [Neisseria chenwenguii]|nr:hypothetical protein [Neisseria chenwenguii]